MFLALAMFLIIFGVGHTVLLNIMTFFVNSASCEDTASYIQGEDCYNVIITFLVSLMFFAISMFLSRTMISVKLDIG
jgi:hypothetical protein